MTVETHLTGKIDAKAVTTNIARVPREIVERFMRLADATGTVSDAMDELGVRGTIPASILRPTIPGTSVVGTAITLRNIAQRTDPYANAVKSSSRMAEIEAHNQAQPGDVLVIQGVAGVSNMGGISATIGKRQGEVAAVVEGGVRDVSRSRSIGFPVWSSEVSPITGKWRAETVEINGPVYLAGVVVRPGDIVVADDTGVCFVPAEMAERVVVRAEEISNGEAVRVQQIDSGLSIHDLANKRYVYQHRAPGLNLGGAGNEFGKSWSGNEDE